jgi:hypothetical protein
MLEAVQNQQPAVRVDGHRVGIDVTKSRKSGRKTLSSSRTVPLKPKPNLSGPPASRHRAFGLIAGHPEGKMNAIIEPLTGDERQYTKGLQSTLPSRDSPVGHLLSLRLSGANRGSGLTIIMRMISAVGGPAHALTTHKSGCPALLAFVARGRGF